MTQTPATQANPQTSKRTFAHVDIAPGDNSLEGTRKRNFLLMILFYINLRVGWIFKTESIIIPAVVDSIAGPAWLRGCLPMLNRFGQSIPPLLASDRVRRLRLKKYCLTTFSMMMGCCFLALSMIWYVLGVGQDGVKAPVWLPFVFLFIYGLFFASVGLSQLAANTLRGKLVPAKRRGQLAICSTTVGAAIAVTFAWLFLRRWLVNTQGNFTYIFAFTGFSFVIGSLITMFFVEGTDQPKGKKRAGLELFKRAVATLVLDKNFRLLAIIAALLGMCMTLFPHYQSLGRGNLKLGMAALVPWVIAQNLGAAFFSIPTGWLGDRFGYRRVLRILMLLICISPILAIVLSKMGETGQQWYFCVFVLLGLTPVTMNAFNNYTLEIVEGDKHPRYLSTLSLCMAAPVILTSTLLGLLIDFVGFDIIFGVVTAMLFTGWMLTHWLIEPRDRVAK